MSEPLSSNDIEDVVSSVRRLVSPEARPRPVSRDLGMDRLILTPSLRIVVEHQASGPAVIKLEALSKKARTSSSRTKTRMISAPILTVKGAEVLMPVQDQQEPLATSLGAVASLSEMALSAEEAELVSDDPVAEVSKPEQVKTRRRAVSAKSAPAKARAKPKAVGARAAKAVKSAVEVAPTVTLHAAEPAAEAQPQDVAPVADAILAPVEAFPEVADEILALEPPVVQPSAALTDAEGNPISLLDEDQLIQLLRRVIRDELQGALGEKITRNVRKLVRAELARALTAETLE